jgi:hypothetical protein
LDGLKKAEESHEVPWSLRAAARSSS